MRPSRRLAVWLGGTASTPTLGLDVRPTEGSSINVLHPPRRSTAAHFSANAAGPAAVSFLPPEARQLVQQQRVGRPFVPMRKFTHHLRADLYDELLKLPLRFALHDFDTLERHLMEGGRGRSSGLLEEGEVMPGVFKFPSLSSSPSSSSSTESDVYYAIASKQASSVGYASPLGPADPIDVLPFFVHRTSTGLLPGRVHSMNAKNLMPYFYLRIGNIDGDIFRFEEELIKIFPTKKTFVRRHVVYVYNVNLDGKQLLHHWLLGLGF